MLPRLTVQRSILRLSSSRQVHKDRSIDHALKPLSKHHIRLFRECVHRNMTSPQTCSVFDLPRKLAQPRKCSMHNDQVQALPPINNGHTSFSMYNDHVQELPLINVHHTSAKLIQIPIQGLLWCRCCIYILARQRTHLFLGQVLGNQQRNRGRPLRKVLLGPTPG